MMLITTDLYDIKPENPRNFARIINTAAVNIVLIRPHKDWKEMFRIVQFLSSRDLN